MKNLFDLSLRHKFPLWGGVLIFITAIAIVISFGLQAYGDMKKDMMRTSEGFGHTIIKAIYPALLHDNIWRAFEIISAHNNYINDDAEDSPFQAKALIIINQKKQVFVSSKPKLYPIQQKLDQLGSTYAILGKEILQAKSDHLIIKQQPESGDILLALPVISDDVVLGGLIMVHSTSAFWARFFSLVERAVIIVLIILAILLPVNWYWGRRMALPMILLAKRLSSLGEKLPEDLNPNLYAYNDELGKIFQAFSIMLRELREKAFLEKQMLQSERMAAIGQLSAGLAHEINNPLAGMLMAIDTIKQHGSRDKLTIKTISLLERGLLHIKETTSALLVEAKIKSHPLGRKDIEDVKTLMTPKIQKLSTHLVLENQLEDDISLPATLIRQILINLLLNAIDAAGEEGHVECYISVIHNQFAISVSNDGRSIPENQLPFLYEPFNSMEKTGRGIGLWVIYQIIHQLNGNITANSDKNITLFTVNLPLEESL